MREINEVWRPIEGFECLYEVSNLGRVKSFWFNKEKILKPNKTKWGYLYVVLCKDGRKKNYNVHRLVANAFLPNIDNLPEVNHIDEDKTNNRVDNLEWCDKTYNIRYSQSVEVNQFTKDGRFIRTWDCINEIQNQLGYNTGHICKCCKGKLKSAYGFIWRYTDDPLQPEPPLF